MSNYRSNDGLDASNTSDAYGDSGRGGRDTYRSNDGLDTSGTSDAYNQTSGGGGNYRSNDGLDAAGTSDAYGSSGNQGGGSAYRSNDGLDPSGTTDASGDSGYGRRTNAEARDQVPGGKSGGLGYDASGTRGGDQETSQHTSGGLGADDTYGDEADTGGADTGYDHNYGMGTGRTVSQEAGAPLPTEPGRDDIRRQGGDFDDRQGEYKPEYRDDNSGNTQGQYGSSGGRGNQDQYGSSGGGSYGDQDQYGSSGGGSSGGKNQDSTAGKLMEKAGGMLKNENLRQKGQEKRMQAGGNSGDGDDY